MAEKKKNKKWYDTWWGLLWTLAIVEGSPGYSVRRFIEMDNQMKNLTELEDKLSVREPPRSNTRKVTHPCPEPTSATCRI